MSDYDCPYCGAEQHRTEAMGEETLDAQCTKCDKNFRLECSYLACYEAEKADCLNDGEHDWEQCIGFPKTLYIGKFRCTTCDAWWQLFGEAGWWSVNGSRAPVSEMNMRRTRNNKPLCEYTDDRYQEQGLGLINGVQSVYRCNSVARPGDWRCKVHKEKDETSRHSEER